MADGGEVVVLAGVDHQRLVILDRVCAGLAAGTPLTVICRQPGMPSTVTVWRWAQEAPEVAKAIARARDDGYDAIALEALQIADVGSGDSLRDRLRVDTRLKLLAKWSPRYADRSQHEISGPNGGAVIIEAIARRIVD